MSRSTLFATYFFGAGFLALACAESASEKTDNQKDSKAVAQAYDELASQMNEAQMKSVLAGVESLPETGTLADALRTERDFFAGWFRRKIEDELKAWGDATYGSNGFRFPQDLRLAGVVLLPDRPVRISLHNTRNGQTFWLEQGKTANGIRIERVEYNPPRALILHNGVSAMVDLEKETIEPRYVPWEVLISAFGALNGRSQQELSDSEKVLRFGSGKKGNFLNHNEHKYTRRSHTEMDRIFVNTE